MIALCLSTKHDKNGNPRRVWLFLGPGGDEPIAIVREGYAGRGGVATAYRQHVAGDSTPEQIGRAISFAFTLNVTPGQYRDWANDARAIDA